MLTKLGATAPMAWLLSQVGHHIDRFFIHRFGKSFIGLLSGQPIVTLTSTGAKSGLPRAQPLLAIRDPQRPRQVALIASNWGQGSRPNWYYNLQANPEVTISENGRTQNYVAREATATEYDHYWQVAIKQYPGYESYKNRLNGRHIPIMILRPVKVNSRSGEAIEQYN